MNTGITTKTSANNVTQLSPKSDVIDRLSEIRRRLVTTRANCEGDSRRRLIIDAEHEICRAILLLEAEVKRI